MKTLKLDLNTGDYGNKIKTAGEILKNGGIVAIPTETVYGLAASAYNDTAVENVFKAKGRPQDNPLIVHIADIEMLDSIAAEIPETAKKCAQLFWPGPFTMVLKRTDAVCKSVSAGLDTVAVRMPSNTVARDIIRAAGIPLAAPSANISGYPSPTSGEHVIRDLDGKIDAVVIADNSTVGVESTVVTLALDTPRLLRPGAVTLEQLRNVLPDITVDRAVLSQPEKDEKVASPGMKYKHYSPKTDVFMVEGNAEQYAAFVNGKSGVAVGFDEDTGIKIPFMSYGKANDETTLAHNIFNVLRNLDDTDYKTAYVHAPSKTGVGLAVYNRLIRAAAFKVIKL